MYNINTSSTHTLSQFLYGYVLCFSFLVIFYVLSTGFVYCRKLRAAAATTITNGEPDKLQGTEFQLVLFVFIFLLSYDTRIYRQYSSPVMSLNDRDCGNDIVRPNVIVLKYDTFIAGEIQ